MEYGVSKMKKTVFIIISILMPTFMFANSKVLKVGTTGDYPPITYYNQATNQYSGFAIKMAESLAKYLNMKVEFIKTTWPTMASDLENKKFDIAMGGITKTRERSETFLLSDDVIKTGKVPLIRVEDKNKYKTLKEIDQPSVIIIENRGGTNMTFAKKHIKNAKIIFINQNEKTFSYLIDHKADVMFTTLTEALYREKTAKGLYAEWRDHPMEESHTVYMMQKNNIELQKKVNSWLKKIKEDGILKKYYHESLNEHYN